MGKDDEPLTPIKLDEEREEETIVKETLSKIRYYKVIMGTNRGQVLRFKKEQKGKPLKAAAINSNIKGPRVGKIIAAIPGSESEDTTQWKHPDLGAVWLDVREKKLFKKEKRYLQELEFTIGMRVLVGKGNNGVIKSLEDGRFTVKFDNGRTKSVDPGEISSTMR